MKRFFSGVLVAAALASSAFAQSGVAVKQSGNVTPNQVPWWVTSGVIGGGVSSADSPVTSFGVTNNGGNGICVNSDRVTAAGRVQLCLGASTTSNAVISVQNYGTANPQGFNVNINGTVYPFPGAVLPSITVGTTAVSGTTNGYFLYNNAGVLGGFNLFGTANNWTAQQTVAAPVSATSYIISSDTILTHPLTPGADHDPGTIITLGKLACNSLAPIHSTEYITCVGFSAGTTLTTADHITLYGAFAGASLTGTSTSNNTFMGIDSGRFVTIGGSNTGVGEHTFTSPKLGAVDHGTAIGLNAGFNLGGSYNTVGGFLAGAGNASNAPTGTGNTFWGAFSGNNIQGNAQFNAGFAYQTLLNLSTGSGNLAMGYLSCQTVTTGSNNICIGTVGNIADVPTATTNNYLNIANQIFGTAGGGIAIGVTTPGGGNTLRLGPQTFAALTTCAGSIDGTMAVIADGSTATWGAMVAGGGSNNVMVFCDGTNWTVMGK